ncbi:hypothetical protein AB0901_05150 [Streptomyces roseifaciens]
MISGIGAAAAVLGAAAPGVAAGDDTTLPSAVETFEYPGAAKILKERGIELDRGDGHILLADCKVSQDIVVLSLGKEDKATEGRGRYCFRVTGSGKKGYLSLQIPDTYAVMSNKTTIWMSSSGGSGIVPKDDMKPLSDGATVSAFLISN